jgi:hypothetical protein
MSDSRIDGDEARRQVQDGRAVLVCAYDDDARCARAGVPEAMPYREFQDRFVNLPWSRRLIFVCG